MFAVVWEEFDGGCSSEVFDVVVQVLAQLFRFNNSCGGSAVLGEIYSGLRRSEPRKSGCGPACLLPIEKASFVVVLLEIGRLEHICSE
jgi:hypothetical protein